MPEGLSGRIEFQLEGAADEGGAVRLPTLVQMLTGVQRTLTVAAREVAGDERTRADYRVVELSYRSPIRCVLEQVEGQAPPAVSPHAVAELLSASLHAVAEGRPTVGPAGASGVGTPLLEEFERLADLSHRAGAVRLGPELDPVPITPEFDLNVRKLLGNVYRSTGTFRGRLEAVNVHSSPCVVNIYPFVGPHRIRCTYPKGRFPRIGDLLDAVVDAVGVMKYRGDEPHPFEIELEDLAAVGVGEAGVADAIVGSMPGITGGRDISAYLAEVRDE